MFLKYYNKYNEKLSKEQLSKQKFIYDKDYELVKNIINKTKVELRTLDVQIVDLADEIAYAAHDLEDGLRLGSLHWMIFFMSFVRLLMKKDKSVEQLENIITESKSKAGFKNHMISAAEFSKLYRKRSYLTNY